MTPKFYEGLFNPNKSVNIDDIEWDIRYEIHAHLKDVIKLAKQGNKYCASNDLREFIGVLLFLRGKFLDEMQTDFLYGIAKQIKRKYNLY